MSRTPEATETVIGLLDHCGWGNLGDAAVQEAVLHNLPRFVTDAEVVGLTLNPEDTERRHGIEAHPLRRGFREYVRWRERTSGGGSGGEERDEGAADRPSATERAKRFLRRLPRLYEALRQFDRRVIGRLRDVVSEIGFLRRSLEVTAELDVLVISGGGQISETWGGPLGHPYTLFKWGLLARLGGARVVVLSVGADDLESGLSRFFARRTLEMAEFVSLRDRFSRDRVADFGVDGPLHVAPDLAYSLDFSADGGPRRRPASGGEGPVAVIPMAYGHPEKWPEPAPRLYERSIGELASIVAALCDRGQQVWLTTTEVNLDRPAVEDLESELRRRGFGEWELIDDRPVDSVRELMRQLSRVRAVLASRFHAVLLPTLLGKPVVAISYHEKVDALMERLGLDRFCHHLEDFTAEGCLAALDALLDVEEAVHEHLVRKARRYRRELDRQFRTVLGGRGTPGAESGVATLAAGGSRG